MNGFTRLTLTGIVVTALAAVAAPTPMPRDATASCADGTWSSAGNRQGACSGHGGMAKWFGKPPNGATSRCNDGTYSKAKDSQGACAKHGGVAFKLDENKPKN